MNKQSNRDFLSDLPLGIIHAILELLPIREAVKTSILSRQWRYKWATLPHLRFQDLSTETSEAELIDIISQLLLLHRGPILLFAVYFISETASRNLNAWLTFLARNGIRMLILNLSDYYFENTDLPRVPSVYSCQNLTYLELSNCDLPLPPPTFKGFLCLRHLLLQRVGVSSNTVQSFIADFSLLEELRLFKLYPPSGSGYDLKINAPNLKILELEGPFQDICLDAPLLREMEVDFMKLIAPRKNPVRTCTELLGGLSTLEELKGGFYFFELLSIGIEYSHTPLAFPHLRFIELSQETFYHKKTESVLAHVCKGAPNLHKIRVLCVFPSRSSSMTSLDLDLECPFNFTFEQLKVIELGYPSFVDIVYGMNLWMKLIKCLLARSPALETLICVRTWMKGELLEQSSTLLTYPRASPNAKIVFKPY